MGTRKAARVRSVAHDDRFSPPVVYLMIEWSSSGQGFGGLHLDEVTQKDFDRQLCGLFGVARLEDTVGMECTALWPRDGLNEPMEGLERGGRRFTVTGFRRKHWPDKAPSADEVFLSALDAGYVDWEHAPL